MWLCRDSVRPHLSSPQVNAVIWQYRLTWQLIRSVTSMFGKFCSPKKQAYLESLRTARESLSTTVDSERSPANKDLWSK